MDSDNLVSESVFKKAKFVKDFPYAISRDPNLGFRQLIFEVRQFFFWDSDNWISEKRRQNRKSLRYSNAGPEQGFCLGQ